MANTAIPNRLDDPPKFLWWDFDVAMLVMIFMVFGIMLDHPIYVSLLGVVIAWLYSKTKIGNHRAYGLHLLYWYLPLNFGMKVTPPSSIREFIG